MAVSTITITSGASTLIPTVEPVVLTLGTVGPQGVPGAGVPAGGTVNQILAKTGAANYATGWIDNYTTDVRIAAKNDSGTTLAKGTVVYVSGANGTNVLIKPAIATSDTTSATTIGLTLQSMIPNNTNWVITQGTLSGINTAAATAGDPVWLSGTVAGGLVFGFANEPQAPTHLVYLGTVTRAHATLGSIEVKINNGWELNELHNVKITSPANGQVLTYDSAQSLWVNSSETGDISAVNVTSPITGGGTSGAVTIGIDQTALAIGPSQVTGTAVITTDPRLSDARTPTAHASSHAAAGSDPVTLAQSQVTNLTTDLAGKAALASANAFTVGGHTITNTVAATIPLKITGAAGQSGAYFEVRDSANAIKMQVSSTGQGFFGGGTGNYATAPMMGVLNGTAAQIGLIVKGASGQTGNLQEWQDNAGTVLSYVSAAGNIRTTVAAVFGSTSYGAMINATPSSTTTVGAVIRGAASQTANLQEWQNSAGTVLARLGSGGFLQTTSDAQVGGVIGIGGAAASGTGQAVIYNGATSRVTMVVRGIASQTADLFQAQDSGGGVLVKMLIGGNVIATDFRSTNTEALLGAQNSGGRLRMAKATAANTNPGADVGTIYFRDGTVPGTLKLVVRAGAAGAETTILDNIPQ